MKTLSILTFGALILAWTSFPSLQAQVVLSPRRLTRRVAPQPAPAQPGIPPPAAPAAVAPPAVVVIQPPVDPVKMEAERQQALRNAVEFRKQREQEDAADTNRTDVLKSELAPVIIGSMEVEPDPGDSLQFIDLSVTNRVSAPVSRLTMRLVYYDARGIKRKEWTTRRELDQPLPGKTSMELSEPAYFMPLLTRRIQVDVREVRFADGKTWTSDAN